MNKKNAKYIYGSLLALFTIAIFMFIFRYYSQIEKFTTTTSSSNDKIIFFDSTKAKVYELTLNKTDNNERIYMIGKRATYIFIPKKYKVSIFYDSIVGRSRIEQMKTFENINNQRYIDMNINRPIKHIKVFTCPAGKVLCDDICCDKDKCKSGKCCNNTTDIGCYGTCCTSGVCATQNVEIQGYAPYTLGKCCAAGENALTITGECCSSARLCNNNSTCCPSGQRCQNNQCVP